MAISLHPRLKAYAGVRPESNKTLVSPLAVWSHCASSEPSYLPDVVLLHQASVFSGHHNLFIPGRNQQKAHENYTKLGSRKKEEKKESKTVYIR